MPTVTAFQSFNVVQHLCNAFKDVVVSVCGLQLDRVHVALVCEALLPSLVEGRRLWATVVRYRKGLPSHGPRCLLPNWREIGDYVCVFSLLIIDVVDVLVEMLCTLLHIVHIVQSGIRLLMSRVFLQVQLFQVFDAIIASELHLSDLAEVQLLPLLLEVFLDFWTFLSREIEVEFLESRLCLDFFLIH